MKLGYAATYFESVQVVTKSKCDGIMFVSCSFRIEIEAHRRKQLAFVIVPQNFLCVLKEATELMPVGWHNYYEYRPYDCVA